MDEDDQFELELPIFIELKPSSFASNDLGVFCTMPLNSEQFLGNYKGKTRKSMAQCADSTYVWTILSSRQVPIFYIDASDPKDSNWLRFIRSTSDPNKYNTICIQQNQQISYFTHKNLKMGDELVTYFPAKKHKKRNKNLQNKCYKLVGTDDKHSEFNYETKNKLDNGKSLMPSNELILKEKFKYTDKEPFKFALVELIKANNENQSSNNLVRQINKCILCPFVAFTDSENKEYSNDKLKEHFLKNHLIQTWQINHSDSSDLDCDSIIKNLISAMLDKIESFQSNKSPYNFKCYICKKTSPHQTFESKSSLTCHYNSSHPELKLLDNFHCVFCDEVVTYFDKYLNHLNMHHNLEVAETLIKFSTPIVASNLKSESEFANLFELHDILAPKTELLDVKSNKIDEAFDKEMKLDVIDEDSQSTKSTAPSLITNESINKNSESSIDKEDNDIKCQKDDAKDIPQTSAAKQSEKSPKKIEVNGRKQTPSPTPSNQTVVPTRTYTCQMCKKQFDQRVDLNKHQCIELNLKLLKKKKEIRKKKWREAHWKRKIDLSYIETTSLTFISQNIADNLSFCIDGTSEDLKAYSREVKDYLNTELGHESQVQMTLRSLNLYEKIVPKQITNIQGPLHTQVNQTLENCIQKKSDSYFVDAVHNDSTFTNQLVLKNKATNGRGFSSNNATQSTANTGYQCKHCRAKCAKLNELIHHQRESHDANINTTYDFYDQRTEFQENLDESAMEKTSSFLSSELYATSPVGYYGSDPFAYIINYYWDQNLPKKCAKCDLILTRTKYRKHVLSCSVGSNNSMDLETLDDKTSRVNDENYISNEEKPIIKSETGADDNDLIIETCNQVIGFIMTSIENDISKSPIIDEINACSKNRSKRSNEEIESDLESKPKKSTPDSDRNSNESLLPDAHLRKESSPSKLSVTFSKSDQNDSSGSDTQKPQSLRVSSRIRRSNQKKLDEKDSSTASNIIQELNESPSKNSDDPDSKKIKPQNASLVTVKSLNNRKIHTCLRCGLEFTSANSVFRHQEKSCLRVRVINLKSNKNENKQELTSKKKCPICSCTFFNTHRLSIHIYKHHRNLLGSALQAPTAEAKRLNEIQLKKFNSELIHELSEDMYEVEKTDDEVDGDISETDEIFDEESVKATNSETISELNLTASCSPEKSTKIKKEDTKLNSTF